MSIQAGSLPRNVFHVVILCGLYYLAPSPCPILQKTLLTIFIQFRFLRYQQNWGEHWFINYQPRASYETMGINYWMVDYG